MNFYPSLKGEKHLKGKGISLIERFRKAKFLALVSGLSLAYQLIFPNVMYALTGGPASPDFASFEPVATTNMVNEFTGQFTYNIPVLEIPGANGGGYAMSLSYHSGDGPEAEASWVGAGWTLNPGSINRVKRGVPDDYNGQSVTYYNQIPKNWTFAMEGGLSAEFASVMSTLSASASIRYNNNKGFGISQNFTVNAVSGMFSLGYNFTGGEGTYSTMVNPAAILSLPGQIARKSESFAGSIAGRNMIKITESAIGGRMRGAVQDFVGTATSRYVGYLRSEMTAPVNLVEYTGGSMQFSGRTTLNSVPNAQISLSSMGANATYTYQQTVGQRGIKTFGYMYLGNSFSNDDTTANSAIMDYTVENESSYNPRDLYMPVPTSTPDAFMVSGEGIGGAFRMYNDRVGIFSPNFVRNRTYVDVIGFDIHSGSATGAGTEVVDNGEQILEVRSSLAAPGTYAKNNGSTEEFFHVPYQYDPELNTEELGDVSEPMFFRFNNDLGGKVVYDDNDNPILATIGKDGGGSLPSSIKKLRKDVKVPASRRSGRSSYIGFHTNGEIRKMSGGKHPLAYEKNAKVHTQAGIYEAYNPGWGLDDRIGEISVNNEDGNNYVYGLPVYCISESNMMYGVYGTDAGQNYYTNASLTSTRVGEEYTSPYISSYLLTQITTPDYLDVNFNGPDDSDFGGYTKFIYKPLYSHPYKSGASNFYKWRAPYKGVFYRPGKNSDSKDNMGSYQSGYKEIYMLDTIETKTHYATFITDARTDGWSAEENDALAAEGNTAVGTGKVTHKLREIRLYAKSMDPGVADKLVKTVHFQYDYSSWPNLPNSNGTAPQNGKLTLKRVWFEYNGVVNAAISPYEFQYTYSPSAYPSKYASINSEMNISGLEQEPDYNPYIDCWGNYQYDGQNRRNKLQSWVDQTKPETFDPAAWQLKKIVLPSGGEIHVQYEEHSYSHVQDRMACAMVSLQGDPEDMSATNKFYLNLADLDIDAGSTSEKQRLVDSINRFYASPAGVIYYKFFYTLYGTGTQNLGNCNGEYVDGFAGIAHAGIDGGGVYVELDETVPYKTCMDLVQKEVGGRINKGSCAPSPNEPLDPGADIINSLPALAKSFAKSIEAHFSPILNNSFCKAINPSMSYLRIPVWNKKGGGVRVKRLLMYNKGIEAGSEALYGTQYIYENEQTGESYGVATNEPTENPEENPLVDLLNKRTPLTTKQRRYQGRDVDQFRGPVSMNALPSPSIGYRRVIKKNIHQDKYTGTGYSVADYYTVKDYPFDMYYPAIDKRGASWTPIQLQNPDPSMQWGFFKYTINSHLALAQGYCFIQNQMHGQLKSVSDYPGVYDMSFYNRFNPPSPVSQQEYEYFEPGELIPMFDFNTYGISYEQPGKEMDITIDRRAVIDQSTITRITGDITSGAPYVFGYPVTSKSSMVYNALVTNKVIHYPAILKSTKTTKEGYVHRTDNIAFDPLTTRAVVTRTYDGYDGLSLYGYPDHKHFGRFTQYDVPASSQYQGMGQKAWNEKYSYFANSFSVSGSGSSYTVGGVNGAGIFAKGDLVAIHNGSSVALGNVIATSGSDLTIAPAKRYNLTITTGTYDKIEIISSGYTNQLKTSMGGFLEYGGSVVNKKNSWQFLVEVNKALADLMSGPSVDSVVIDMSEYGNEMAVSDYCPDCSGTQLYGFPIGYIVVLRNGSTYSIGARDAGHNSFGTNGLADAWAISNIGSLTSGDIPVSGYFTFGYPFSPPNVPPTCGSDVAYDWLTFVNMQISGLAVNQRWCALGFRFCTDDQFNYTEGALKASTTLFKDSWDYDTFRYHIPHNLNDYEAGKLGKWRAYETYVLDDSTLPGADPDEDERIYKGAGVSYHFKKAPWQHIHLYHPSIWTRSSKVMSYSPNGDAQEELNVYGRASAAKFGYYGILPYAVAKNAHNAAVRFESFENVYNNYYVEDSVQLTNNFVPYPHTGHQAFELKKNATMTFHRVYDSLGAGHVMKFWIRTDDTSNYTSNLTVKANATTLSVKYLGRAASWALFEARYTGTASTGYIDYSIKAGNDLIIDDVRIQPIVSTMTTYVYDIRTMRLSATLDENNMATFYQYNGEGKLVRKRIETRSGVRTLEEAQYHIPKRRNLKDIGNY